MNFHKLQLVLVASALGGAMGMASAQQAGVAASGSVESTPAAAKTEIDIRGNAALTNDVALSGSPRQGSPGTQSGVAVTDTTSMGAGASREPLSSQSLAGLSRTQARDLQRYNALR